MNIINSPILSFIHGHKTIFDDEDETDDNITLEKTNSFSEETVPRFTNKQFKLHFRMSPDTFEDFLTKLGSVTNRKIHVGQPEMLLEKQALMTLWCLANIESLRSVADRFGVTKSTCWAVLYRTCFRILDLNTSFKIIQWPSRQRSLRIMGAFQAVNGFEGVIGCIDGCHIRILPPSDHPNSYCNRKNYHSILLQGVCDDRKLFTHVYAGEPGSIHDNRLLEKSDLYRDMESGVVEFPNDSFIVGDLAYKLNKNIMVGFKNTGNLTDRQKNFNLKLSQVRVAIENAYALLKGRFRRLKYLETTRLDFICLLTISGCILHNICILNGDDPDIIMDLQQELEEERLNRDIVVPFNVQHQRVDNQLAVAKRDRIMNQLDMADIF